MSAAAVAPTPAPPRGALAKLGRVAAMLVLVCAIVPVPLLGPALVRAPLRLTRQLDADLVRLQRMLAPAHEHRGPVHVRHRLGGAR